MVTTPPSTPCDNVSHDQPSAMNILNVVNGEIVMVDGEAQQPPGWDVSPRSSGKRPSSCMEEEIHQHHHHHHHHHNEGTSSPHTESLQQISEQVNPMHGPRVRLTESETWAHSWGSGHDSKTHGGEYYYNIGGMVATVDHSSPGFNRHSSNSSLMNMNVSVDGTGRLMQAPVGESMVEPSSARFQIPSPNLQQAMIPVSSNRSNFRPAMNIVSSNSMLSRSAPAATSVQCFSKGLSSNSSKGTSNSGEEMRRRHRPKRYSATLFDQELERYESQIARTASENVMRQLNTRLARSLSCPEDTFLLQVGPGGAKAKLEKAMSETPHNLSLANLHAHQFPSPSSSGTIKIGGAAGMKSVPEMKLGPFMTLLDGGSHNKSGHGNPPPMLQEEPKLQSTDSSIDDKGICTWIEPLRFLLRKGLTVSDVGELGRVVLPKKDAECQLPQIDVKEGRMIKMVDHNCMRQWVFRYKWWLNNKSRMYVLENTGEFMRYHDLKEKDALTLYEDGIGTLVIHGEKRRDTFPSRFNSRVESSLQLQVSSGCSSEDSNCQVTSNTNSPAALVPEIKTLARRLSANLMLNASPTPEDGLPMNILPPTDVTEPDDHTEEGMTDPNRIESPRGDVWSASA